MQPRSRRTLLRLLGAGTAGLLAGCDTGPSTATEPPTEPPDTETATPTPTPSPTATDSPTPAVQDRACAEPWSPLARWRFETGIRAYAPTVRGDTVYFGAQDDNVYALDVPTAAVRWQRDQPVRLYGTPAVLDGTVVVAGYGQVVALALDSGARRWSYEPPGRHGGVDSDVAVTGERVVFAATNYAGTQEEPAETPYTRLYGVDGASGEPVWHRGLDRGSGTSGLAGADGIIYRTTPNGAVVAHDAGDGTTVWRRRVAGDQTFFDPRLDEDRVYVQDDGLLAAVDRTSGAVVWREDGDYRGEPAVGDGLVYCVAHGELVAVDAATGERVWRAALHAPDVDTVDALDVAGDAVYLSVPTPDGAEEHAYDAATGCLLGRFPTGVGRTTRVATTAETVLFGGLHGDGAMYAVSRP